MERRINHLKQRIDQAKRRYGYYDTSTNTSSIESSGQVHRGQGSESAISARLSDHGREARTGTSCSADKGQSTGS